MFLDDLPKRFADMQTRAGVKAVFGDVIELDGRRVIPVAAVQYGFGMGGGTGPKKGEGDAPGGGGGGAVRVEPIAVIEATDGRLRVRPVINISRLVTIGALLAAWWIFWASRTVRAVAGARSAQQKAQPQ